MPTIYDNIETDLLSGLCSMLANARRADFCVGYFNLRGWAAIEKSIEALSGEDGKYARLIVGMTQDPAITIRQHYDGSGGNRMTQGEAVKLRQKMVDRFAHQLTSGNPTNADERTLSCLAHQLREQRLVVKLYTRHPLHAKLYLTHRADKVAAIAGFVGSSNLTFPGLSKNGELNVDVVEQDAAQKLAHWFNERWNDDWSIDISEALADIIERSWAGGPVPPYHVYIKTAWHLSREAMEEAQQFYLPAELDSKLLEHQKSAVKLAAQRLNHQRGVIIGDVVGLGKTLVATAVAKVFQEDHGDSVLVICPPTLKENWEMHLHTYCIAGKVHSLGATQHLATMRRYRLVILDESHNLRNRKSARHRQVRDYIRDNESRVIMLTATPYNKSFEDIASQLRLFLDGSEDLGIKPEDKISKMGGILAFKSKYPHIQESCLSAFEQSEEIDDWRELMRLFMVRRTRAHIKENYAKYDTTKERHYLTFADGQRFYFPLRQSRNLNFKLEDKAQDDQYAQLYSDKVVQLISDLKLPRYGLKKYLSENAEKIASEGEKTVIDNLSRAGKRLIGFARTNLFKRLESGGDSFLLSLRRHILRNAVFIAACTNQLSIPISQITPKTMEALDDEEIPIFTVDSVNWDNYLTAGESLLTHINNEKYDDFDWIDSNHFTLQLVEDLILDSKYLLEILTVVPQWHANKDRKLAALRNLCTTTHKTEKILIFTEFKDTAVYLHNHLQKDIEPLALLHGDSEVNAFQDTINRFSPQANGKTIALSQQKRVLITTDKLSEGVNLQDAHIIVNYDLPWAIIRLIQRAGRVDRIGQPADIITCYSAIPEKGIERIINLRRRLRDRMQQNNELIGSDEKFFEEDSVDTISRLYTENIGLEDEEDETDLISRAYEIWRQAILQKPSLEKEIKAMPDVVYSAKKSKNKGVIAYIKDNRNQHVLTYIDTAGEIISQSQYKILNMLACPPEENAAIIADNHHEKVAKVVEHCRQSRDSLGGQLGGENSIRRRVYTRLSNYNTKEDNTFFASDDLKKAIEQIYNYPLRDNTSNKLRRQISSRIKDHDLAMMVIGLWRDNKLCETPKTTGEESEIRIICSMGLV